MTFIKNIQLSFVKVFSIYIFFFVSDSILFDDVHDDVTDDADDADDFHFKGNDSQSQAFVLII